jgi:hypothetical protein
MQDPYIIMDTGFENTVAGTGTTGYQIDIRIPYDRAATATGTRPE